MQAMISISSVDGVPLPSGEEFTGVIRTQDVRATEKDKVKLGDCFRGGDVVRGLVVSQYFAFSAGENKFIDLMIQLAMVSRFLWEMLGATT
jgi:exosome complex RNA-binding protein Csl4